MAGVGVIVGLDLSLRASAAVAVPADWDGDWTRVRSLVVGESLPKDAGDESRALRTFHIATAILKFARDVKASEVWIEGYAFSQAKAAHSLGELGGVARLSLVRAGFPLHTVTASASRKLLLGAVPRKNQKGSVQDALKSAGAPRSWSADEFDAFTAANFGLSEVGGYCFATQEAA